MFNNGILLIEICTEELSVKILKKINKIFKNYLSYELKKNYFFYSKIKIFTTLRKLACLIYNFNYYQKLKKKYKIIYGPSLNLNKNNLNFFNNKKILRWINKFKLNINKINFINNNGIKKFFFKKKILPKSIDSLICKILNNVFIYLIKNFRSMKWGINKFIFFMPVTNIIVMFNDFIIKLKIFGIKSNNILLGHRFIGNKNIILKHANNYIYDLFKYGKIIVDYNYRKNKILKILNKISIKFNFFFNYSNSFFEKIVLMSEWPTYIICKFNKKFLSLPKEFIIFILEKNYCFSIFDSNDNLLNNFIVIINIEVNDYTNIIKGYEKNIESKLNDINFLFLKDRKFNLISYLPRLKYIIFYEKLGSYFDKIKRILFLSKNIYKYFNINLNIINYIILFLKCDLSTHLYRKYPKLNGIIGMNYALLDGINSKIALIIKNHYIFFKFNNFILNDIYCIFIILIDKIDTLVGISIINNFVFLKNSNDPYGLKNISFCIINVILSNKIYINLYKIVKYSIFSFLNFFDKYNILCILKFIINRFISILISLGYKKNIIKSIINLNYFNLFDIKNRLDLIINIKNSNNFKKLVNINKRINNILLKFNISENIKFNKLFIIKNEEFILYKYIFFLKKKINYYFIKYNYLKLMKHFFISIKKIKNFFKFVKINVNNINVKNNRLFLLKEISKIFKMFIDLSYYY